MKIPEKTTKVIKEGTQLVKRNKAVRKTREYEERIPRWK